MTDPSARNLHVELERLRRAERRKDEFLGQLAHQVGNVLVPLPLALEILKQPGLTETTVHRVREILEEQAVEIQRLIGQLRSVARLSRAIELDLRPIEARALIERAMAAVRPRADECRQRLDVAVPDEPLRVHADVDRLEQALAHVLDNAVRCTDPGGRIQVDAMREGDELAIRVSDSGRGIAPELLPEIFEPFVRGEPGIDWSEGRLGIGLALARHYIGLHGGTVTAVSAGPGQGSTFVVRLPLDPSACGGG